MMGESSLLLDEYLGIAWSLPRSFKRSEMVLQEISPRYFGIARYLSAEASLGDRVSFPWQPRWSANLTNIVVRMTTWESAISQLRRVVILEGPSLSRCTGWAFFHHQLLLALCDRQTLVAAAMPDVISLRTVYPLLIPFTTMARIENYVAAAVVQARFVPTYFTRFTEHPVLISTLSMAGIESARLVQIGLASGRIQTGVSALAEVPDLSWGDRLARDEEFWVNVV